MEIIMKDKDIFFPLAPKTKQALSFLFDALAENLDSPEVTVTAGDIVPLFTVILELAGKLEETMAVLDRRIAIAETAAFSRKAAQRSGSARRARSGR
jgi:hypothetical protein